MYIPYDSKILLLVYILNRIVYCISRDFYKHFYYSIILKKLKTKTKQRIPRCSSTVEWKNIVVYSWQWNIQSNKYKENRTALKNMGEYYNHNTGQNYPDTKENKLFKAWKYKIYLAVKSQRVVTWVGGLVMGSGLMMGASGEGIISVLGLV